MYFHLVVLLREGKDSEFSNNSISRCVLLRTRGQPLILNIVKKIPYISPADN